MRPMTTFRQCVIGVAAVLVAARVFFPVESMRRFGGTDFATTVLHVIGILVLASALWVLFPSPHARTVVVIAGWLAYGAGVVIWLPSLPETFPNIERAISYQNLDLMHIDWVPTGLGLGALLLLIGLTVRLLRNH